MPINVLSDCDFYLQIIVAKRSTDYRHTTHKINKRKLIIVHTLGIFQLLALLFTVRF